MRTGESKQRPSRRVSLQRSRSASSTGLPSSSSPSSGAYAPDGQVCICFVTTPNAEVADALSTALVEGQSAACVNQIPGVTSVYMWEGKLNRDSEILLVIKTCRGKVRASGAPAVRRRSTLCLRGDGWRATLTAHDRQVPAIARLIKEKHPYECPELITLDVVDGLPDYLQWVAKSVTAAGPPADGP